MSEQTQAPAPSMSEASPDDTLPVMGGRESVDDALEVVDSFGEGTAGLNDTYARQILLASEVRRLRGLLGMRAEEVRPPDFCPECGGTWWTGHFPKCMKCGASAP